jgi:iron(III) transport system permease protein
MSLASDRLKLADWARIAPDSTRALVAVLTIVLLLLVVPPLWFLLQGSLHTTTVKGGLGDFTFAYYRRLLSDRQFFSSLANSLIFSLGATSIALCFGGLVAWLVERTNTPFKALAYLTAIISLGTPFVLYVIAWLFLLGRAGPLNDLITALGLPRFNVYSMSGMILVEGFLWSPLSFLLLSSVFQAANSEHEEAARMCGAGIVQTVTRISMRLALPGFAAVALLMVVRSIEAFEVPALVGLPGNVKVLTTDIYLDMKENVPPDLGYSSAFSIVLLVLAGGLLSLYSRIARRASRYHTVTGRGFRARLFDLGAGRYLGGFVIVLNFLLILAIPAAGLVWLALMPFTQSISRRGFSLMTLDNFRTVLHSTFYLDLVWQTLAMSAGASTCVMILTILCGWLAVRRRPGGWLLDQLATAPLIFPGIVLGVAMM